VYEVMKKIHKPSAKIGDFYTVGVSNTGHLESVVNFKKILVYKYSG